MFSTKYSLQNAWLTVYVYSSQTPLKQVDINLPVESGVIRMTVTADGLHTVINPTAVSMAQW